jgi:hypothetical protein
MVCLVEETAVNIDSSKVVGGAAKGDGCFGAPVRTQGMVGFGEVVHVFSSIFLGV